MGTFIPAKVHLALPTGSHLPDLEYPSIELHQFSGELYTFGVEEHKAGYGAIKVYSQEKTLVDLLRFKHIYGLPLFLEMLKDYLAKKGSVRKLLEAAKVCGVDKQMQDYLVIVLA